MEVDVNFESTTFDFFDKLIIIYKNSSFLFVETVLNYKIGS